MTGLITGNVSSKTGKIKSAYAMAGAGRILIIGYEGEYCDERAQNCTGNWDTSQEEHVGDN